MNSITVGPQPFDDWARTVFIRHQLHRLFGRLRAACPDLIRRIGERCLDVVLTDMTKSLDQLGKAAASRKPAQDQLDRNARPLIQGLPTITAGSIEMRSRSESMR